MTPDPSTPSRRDPGTESRVDRPDRRAVLATLAGLSATVAGCTTADDGSGDDGGAVTTGTATGTSDGDGGTPTTNDAEDGTTTDGEDPTGDETGDSGGGDGEATDDGDSGDEETTDDADTGDEEATDDGDSGDLDLREANVTGVEFDRGGDEYRFSVELYHDDDGEEGYANWWQVETLDGDRLGRRELLHAHGTHPFTRSEAIAVPESVREAVVRGHDQTHGYGGRAAVVDLETGDVEFVDQGPEPEDFSDRS